MCSEEKFKKFFQKEIPKKGINFKAINKDMTLAELKKKFVNNKL